MLSKSLKFLFYNPPRVLLLSWIFILIIYIISPIRYRDECSIKTILFILGAIILFYIGYSSGRHFYKVLREKKDNSYKQNSNKGINFNQDLWANYKIADFATFLALLGLISGVMFIIEYFFLRGVDYSQGLSAARAQIREHLAARGGIPEGRIWSLVARALSGFSPIAAAIALLRPEKFNSNIRIIAIIFSLLILLISQILTGTRNAVFMIIVFLSMTFMLKILREKTYLKYKSTRIYLTALFISIIASFIYFSFIFIDRTTLTNMSVLETYKSLEETFLVNINENFLISATQNQEGLISNIQLVFTYFSIYITHGFHELDLLLSQIPQPGPYYGMYNFSLLLYLVHRLGLIPFTLITEIENSIVRQGYYTTVLGYIYIDFGYLFSFIIFLGLGVVTGFMWSNFITTEGMLSQMICAYILFTIVISPFYSPLAAGNGIPFQILLSIIFLSFVVKNKKFKRVQVVELN